MNLNVQRVLLDHLCRLLLGNRQCAKTLLLTNPRQPLVSLDYHARRLE